MDHQPAVRHRDARARPPASSLVLEVDRPNRKVDEVIGRGHKGRTDANHQAIVKALRQAGASVQSLGMVGNGCPDLLVGRLGRNYLIEVKDGSLTARRRGLTRPEERWRINWAGSWEIAYSVADALRIIGCRAV